jgi:hypothetical protein
MCSHKITKMVDYEDFEWCDYRECHIEVISRRLETWSAFEDIDTHRMKCSICGKIDYYSQSARNFYENGIDRGNLFDLSKKK